MITEFKTNDQIQAATTAIAVISQAISMLQRVPTDAARTTLLTKTVEAVAPKATLAMDVATLFSVLDPTDIGTLTGVDIARLKTAANATLLLVGYVEAISLQTDPTIKEAMLQKLAAAVAPDRAHTNAVDHSVIAVESGPLAF